MFNNSISVLHGSIPSSGDVNLSGTTKMHTSVTCISALNESGTLIRAYDSVGTSTKNRLIAHME
jgi:hypothetical protein